MRAAKSTRAAFDGFLLNIQFVDCASAAYLEKHGTPNHPSDLQRHRVIATEVSTPQVVWKFGSRKAPLSVKLKPILGVTNHDAAVAAALQGIGIVHLPSHQVIEQIQRGGLTAILSDYAGDALPIHLLHRESQFGSSKVRAFIDLLSRRLRAEQ